MTLRLACPQPHRIRQAIGDNPVSERDPTHWYQKFRSEELSLYDGSHSCRPQVMNDEALKAGI